MPNNTLSKLIKGKTENPRNETMRALVKLFRVDHAWLSDGTGTPPVPTGVVPLKPADDPAVYLAGALDGWERFERRAKVAYAFLIPEEAYLAGREFVLDRWIMHVDDKVVAAISAYAWFSIPKEQQRDIATRYYRAKSEAEDATDAPTDQSSTTMRSAPPASSK